MAESSGGGAYCTASLPLVIKGRGQVIRFPEIENITQIMNADVQYLQKSFSERRNLQFVNITGVKYENSTVFVKFSFNSIESLNEFYECTSKRKKENKLMSCFNDYFERRRLQLNAKLKLSSKLSCKISMPKDVYDATKAQLEKIKESKRRAVENDKQEQEKTFLLYYSSTMGRNINKVALEFAAYPELNKVMTCQTADKVFFKFSVGIPTNILERKLQIKYRFIISGSFSGILYLNSNFEDHSVWYTLKDVYCCRSIMFPSNGKYPQEYWNYWKNGFLAHAEDLMNCPNKCAKDKCKEIAYFYENKMPLNFAVDMVKLLFKSVETKNYDPAACLLLLEVAGLHQTQKEIPQIVDKSQAYKVMNALKTSHLSDFPESSHIYVESIYRELFFKAYECNIFSYWSMAYSFLGIKYVHLQICSHLKYATIIEDSDSNMSEVKHLCEKLFKETNEDSAKESLEILACNLPLRNALECCTFLLPLKKEELSLFQITKQDVIYQILKKRIPSHLANMMHQKNINDIVKTWKIIEGITIFKDMFFSEYEDGVLKILESSDTCNSNNVLTVVDELGFFSDDKNKLRLVQIIVKSKCVDVNNLFFTLAKHHKFENLLKSLSRKEISEIFIHLTTEHSNRSERSKALLFTCKRFNSLWELPQMELVEYREVLEEILVKEFENFSLQQLINNLGEINSFTAQNSRIGEIFLTYCQSVIKRTFVTLTSKPQEIFNWMNQGEENPSIRNMLMAHLLIFVMKTVTKLYRPDMNDRFEDMLHHADFWRIVYTCNGEFANYVYESECLQENKACFVHMIDQFKRNNVSFDFADNMEKDAKQRKAALTLLRLECKEEEICQWWEEALLMFRQEKQRLHTARNVLNSIFKAIRHEELKGDISELLSYVKSKEKYLTTGILIANDCKAIWHCIEHLPELCENLAPIMHSNFFWNVCLEKVIKVYQIINKENGESNCFTEETLEILKDMAVEDHPMVETDRKTIQFMKILSKRGTVFYKRMWEELLENNLLKIDRVLEVFGSEPDIKNEIELARGVLHLFVDTTTENTLQGIYSIDKLNFKVDAVVSTLSAFKIELNKDFSSAIDSFYQLQKGSANDFYFHDVKYALETVFKSTSKLAESTIGIMAEIGKSTSLIDFLQEIVDEDIRYLIDAVENISEHEVRETTVSNLIEVKRYVQPLLTSEIETYQDFICLLESQTQSATGDPNIIAAKVSDCMCHLHNLKSLYNNVANRGEQTKEMIANVIQRGSFEFKLDSESSAVAFEVIFSHDQKGEIFDEKETRPMSTLIDLRSRALLLKNSNKTEANDGPSDKETLSVFIDYIDGCLDIAECLFDLYSSGHFSFLTINKTYLPAELEATKLTLTETLTKWIQNLTHARETYFLLNYIHGTQIQKLFLYLESEENDQRVILTLARFIHPYLNIDKMRGIYWTVKKRFSSYDEQSKLLAIGLTLHKVHEDLVFFERTISSTSSAKITESVKPGRLLVAHLEEGSIFTVKTVLSLYLHTTQRLPEANQLLFCTRYTVWEEINLLIKRCIGASLFYQSMPLFCIANVELLSNELQFALVDSLKNIEKKQKYLLALVCRGSESHPIIDKLSAYVTSVSPATDATVKSLFQEHCNQVLTVTSEQAGQGKSSFIEKEAHLKRKRVTKLHISGTIKKLKLLERLQSMNIKECHMLHIDIGNVDDPTELDTFLFELIILKYVSAGRISVSLKINDIKIEIGNTINECLRNSLQTTVLFQRKQIIWKGVTALSVSKEPDSSVQVVCKYLRAMENDTLDKTDFPNSTVNEHLSRTSCRNLLKKFVSSNVCVSFPVLNTFLDVLADQLKKLSQSTFFKVSRLNDMVGSKSRRGVKSKLVKAMLQMSQDFASRSVAECRKLQTSTLRPGRQDTETEYGKTSALANCSVERMNSLIRWEESNHLIFVFHNQNIHTLSAIYRSLDKVSEDVRVLFESQMNKKMEDFTKLDQQILQSILQKVARTNPKLLEDEYLKDLAQDYALTADNLLKMILIILRVKSNVPVVIMGETGCGKTSLIRYLAKICEVSIDVMCIHSGISEQDIVQTVMKCNRKALDKLEEECWLFLDEINASESIGIMGDIICHHTCIGKELAPNLTVIAACNPYRLRTSKAIATAGLDSKVKTDELSKLVYRVLPLPEMIVDYVWDFGTLSEADERKYIYRMTDNVFDELYHSLFADLLSASQSFVRLTESTEYSVSLRDVQRCKILTKWFLDVLLKKEPLKTTSVLDCDNRIKSMILSLAQCYHSRFSDKNDRDQYRLVIAKVFAEHGLNFGTKNISDLILQIIKTEQMDVIERMQLPPGIACNSALRENVFVILVSIFNRIPIFVVGKPGCSKSLAMQLIKSNLRGKDSTDDFFKSLPQLYCVSFQGSESSTSDGILKVFEKAEKYQENSQEDVLSVVILDEIGLAGVSRFNPLKVLHSLLEPGERNQPNVAVVGISNWALDASKMNRVIHLSRTDMGVEELYDTAISISKSFLKAKKSDTLLKQKEKEKDLISTKDIEKDFLSMAEAYAEYIDQIRFKNFHGLRDYYSLIKYVSLMYANKRLNIENEEKSEIILWGLERNFGGLPAERKTLQEVFSKCISVSSLCKHSVIDLITQNIKDQLARHLMLITTGDSALGIVESHLTAIDCSRKEVIYGSQFEEDLTDDYNYRILSRIILCMEEGVVLILKDLKSVYGSLYDMLNQNYTVIGKKKNCRIALGAYSNPICHVADSFRCIVLIDENQLDRSDPPFLNRFEKQYLRFSDILEEDDLEIIKLVERWIEDLAPNTKKEVVFPIYNEDMVASLILKLIMNEGKTDRSISRDKFSMDILKKCEKELLWVVRPEIIVELRSRATTQPMRFNPNEVISDYFSLPVHDGLTGLIQHDVDEPYSSNNLMCVVFTNSNVHTKIMGLKDLQIQVEKLGGFKSEKQLSSRLQNFWQRNTCDILVVQCNAKSDAKHLLLTKLVIERQLEEYLRASDNHSKRVYLVVHLDRSTGDSNCLQHMNFLSKWRLVMLDSIEKPEINVPSMCTLSLLEAVKQRRPLNDCLKEDMIWAFTRIKYGSQGRDVQSLKCVLEKIESSNEFLELLDTKIWEWIHEHDSGEDNRNWQVKVAQDRSLINMSASFIDAMESFVLSTIKRPLAKIIYKIELTGILDSYFVNKTNNFASVDNLDSIVLKRSVWRDLLHDEAVFNINGIPDSSGPECYLCDTPDIKLIMPFSRTLFDVIEASKDRFMEVLQSYRVHCLISEDEELPTEIYEEVLSRHNLYILQNMPNFSKFLYTDWTSDYQEDFCNQISFQICQNMSRNTRIEYTHLIIKNYLENLVDPVSFVVRLHSAFWVNHVTIRAELLLISASLRLSRIFPNVESEIKAILGTNGHKYTHRSTGIKIQPLIEKERDDRDLHISKFGDTSEECVNELVESITEQIELTPAEPDTFTEKHRSIKTEIECVEEKSIQSKSELVRPDNCFAKVEAECEDTTYSRNGIVCSVDRDSVAEIPSQYTGNDYLVEFLCKRMLPNTEYFTIHNSVEQWLSTVMSALSLAYQVSTVAVTTYSLRICCDIASELIVPFKLDVGLLTNLGNLLNNGYELDSQEVFTAIKNAVNATKNTGLSSGKEVCVRLLSSYFVMCLEVDQESSAIDFLFALIKDSDVPENFIHFLKAPLWITFNLLDAQLFQNILCFDFKVRQQNTENENVLNCRSENESYEERIFWTIDRIITYLFEARKQSHPFLVLLVDLFQNIYENELVQVDSYDSENEDETDNASLTEETFERLYECHKLLNSTKTQKLQYIAAVAYTKAFINQCFSNGRQDLKGFILQDILTKLNPLTSGKKDTPENKSIWLYIFKMLGRHCTLSGLKKIADTKRYEDVPFLRQFKWNSAYLKMAFENKPLCVYLEKEEHHRYAHICKTIEMKSDIEQLTKEAETDELSRFFLLSLAVKEFYLCQYSEPLNYDKGLLAESVINNAKKSDIPNTILLLLSKLCGIQNFTSPELTLSAEVSDDQFCKASFCVSWIALCLGIPTVGNTGSQVFKRILVSPLDIKEMYIPGFHYRDGDSDWKMPLTHPHQSVIAKCFCGNKFAIFDKGMLNRCVVCNSETIDSENAVAMQDDDNFDKIPVKFSKNYCFGVRSLQPVSCHVLQLFTATSLIGSCELGTPLNDVEQLFGISEVDLIQYLWDAYNSHWEKLLELLNINDHKLMVLLHVIALHSKSLLFQTNTVDSTESLVSWETQFEDIISDILPSRFSQSQAMIIKDDFEHGFQERSLEKQILEEDVIGDLPEDSEEKISSLFRISVAPTKINFISELYPRRNEFPFLSQVIESEYKLELPIYALDIIRWHVATVSTANYVMKKNECLNMCVQEFIRLRRDSTNTVSRDISDRFESFRNAWEHLKKKLYGALSKRMTHIYSGSKMSDCLLLDEKSIVYEVLHELVGIQNGFLDRVIQYSSRSNALKFLFRDRGVAVLPIVQVTDMTKENLICCKLDWDELLQRESQCDLFYGEGLYVNYDFHSIEEQVALNCVRGKSFIIMKDSLPKIVFMDELHLNYSSMIRDLKSDIPQKSISHEVKNSIRKKKEEDPRMASDLLTHLGIVMTVLKKTKGAADDALIDYVDKWKSLLGREFPRKSLPSPETDVKLCHVVGLSELLEELCADSMKNGLRDELRENLTPFLQSHVVNILKEEQLALTILNALKRFIFRCAITADPDQVLKVYINDDSFWPLGCFTEGTLVIGDKQYCLGSIIPDDLLVHHIFAYLTTLEAGIKKQQMDNVAMAQFATSFAANAKSNSTSRKPQKQKIAKTYRKR